MRINFDGTYNDIKALISAPDRPVARAKADFAKLLGGISPSEQQAERKEIIDSRRRPQGPPDPPSFDPLALPKMPEPQPKVPLLDRLSEDKFGEISVNDLSEESKSVSSDISVPTILRARRISPHEAEYIERLPRDQRGQQIKQMITALGKKHAVDPALSLAVASAESSFNPNAVSSDGFYTKGLFQLLDSTGKDMASRLDVKAAYNPFNPSQNAELGVGYLRYLHDIFSEETELPNKMRTLPAANSSSLEKLAVAAFNAGEGRVASAQTRAKAAGKNPGMYEDIRPYLPDTTQQYVDKVMASRGSFEARSID